MLTAGEVIKFRNTIWLVRRVSAGSAFVEPLTGGQKPITTRLGKTKMVTAYPAATHISADSMVERVDPESAFARQARRKFMSESTATVETVEQPKAAKVRAPRRTQVYVRTEKEAKEMKGQGGIVMAALDELGQGTVEQLVEKTKGMFTTRQDEARVVGFYLSKFKREGFAKVIETEEPVAEKPAAEIEG